VIPPGAAFFGLLVGMVGWAALSGWELIDSIRQEERISAWGWAALFAGTSVLAAWTLWRLL
jgi:hypothetical protein